MLTATRDTNINDIDYRRVFPTDSVVLTGRLSAGHAPVRIEAAVLDPTLYFERALTQVLREAGIGVLGAGASIATSDPRPPTPDTLFTWTSPTLREMLPLLEKPSQNQIAEALLRTLGTLRGVASVDSGRAVVKETLTGWGIPEDAYVYIDGSGLSRYNYVAPEAVAAVLAGIARHPDFSAFYDALPIAGVDGTVGTRMRGTAAENNLRAKTGSIANVRSLSGYVTTKDGEHLIFVIMANHFTVPPRVVTRVADFVGERLANFSRR